MVIFIKKARLDGTSEKTSVDPSQAIAIARRFLNQYHSLVIFRSISPSSNSWIVSMEVGLLKEDIMAVRIDSKDGRILGYDHLLSP